MEMLSTLFDEKKMLRERYPYLHHIFLLCILSSYDGRSGLSSYNAIYNKLHLTSVEGNTNIRSYKLFTDNKYDASKLYICMCIYIKRYNDCMKEKYIKKIIHYISKYQYDE